LPKETLKNNFYFIFTVVLELLNIISQTEEFSLKSIVDRAAFCRYTWQNIFFFIAKESDMAQWPREQKIVGSNPART
jgi:hypothetical protein